MPPNLPELLQYGAFGLTVIVVGIYLWETARFRDFTQKLINSATAERQKYMETLDQRVQVQAFMLQQTSEILQRAVAADEASHSRQVEGHQKQIDLMKDISRSLEDVSRRLNGG